MVLALALAASIHSLHAPEPPNLTSVSRQIADCKDWELSEYFWLDDRKFLMDRYYRPNVGNINPRPLWVFDTKTKKWSKWGKFILTGDRGLHSVSPNGKLVLIFRSELVSDDYVTYFGIRDEDGKLLGEWPMPRRVIGAVARVPSDFTTFSWLPDSSGIIESYISYNGKTSAGQSTYYKAIPGFIGTQYSRSTINRASVFNPVINSKGEFVEISYSPMQRNLSQVSVWPANNPEKTTTRELTFPADVTTLVAIPSPSGDFILWDTLSQKGAEGTRRFRHDTLWLSNRDGSGLKALAKFEYESGNVYTGWDGIVGLAWKPNGKSFSFVLNRKLYESRLDLKKMALARP